MSRDPLIVSGGNAIMYAAGIIMDLRKKSIQESDPITKEQGIKVGVTIKKNHCVPNRNPYLKTDYFAIFGQGIEQYLETLENAVAQGLLTGGAWIKDLDPASGEPRMRGQDKLMWQGKEKFRNYCIDNPDYFEELKARVKGIAVQLNADEISEIQKDNKEVEDSVPEDVIADAEEKKNKKKK